MTTESRWRKLFHPHTSARVDPVIFYIKISGNVASIGRIPIPPFSTELNSTYRTHFNITCIINLTGSYSKFQLLSRILDKFRNSPPKEEKKKEKKNPSFFLSSFLSYFSYLPFVTFIRMEVGQVVSSTNFRNSTFPKKERREKRT